MSLINGLNTLTRTNPDETKNAAHAFHFEPPERKKQTNPTKMNTQQRINEADEPSSAVANFKAILFLLIILICMFG